MFVDLGYVHLVVTRTRSGVDEHETVGRSYEETAHVEVPPSVVGVIVVGERVCWIVEREVRRFRHRHLAVEYRPDVDVTNANGWKYGHGDEPVT